MMSMSFSAVQGKGQCYNKGSVSHVKSSGVPRASSVCVRGWPLQVGGGGCNSSSVQGEMKRAIVASIAAGVLATAAPALAEDVVDPACVPQPVNGVSGLAYCDIKQGDGPKVVGLEEGDIVRVNFEARSKDEVADKARNFIFGLGSGESCPGFELGIMGKGAMPTMNVGGVRKVSITNPALGFGKIGALCDMVEQKCAVDPNSKDVVFEIELTGVRGLTPFSVGGSSAPPLFSQVSQDWGRMGLGTIPGAPTASASGMNLK